MYLDVVLLWYIHEGNISCVHSPLCIPLPPVAAMATGESTKSMGLDLRLFVEPVADELVRPLPDVPALPPPPLTLQLI